MAVIDLSLAETNRLRAKLGLKLIPEPTNERPKPPPRPSFAQTPREPEPAVDLNSFVQQRVQQSKDALNRSKNTSKHTNDDDWLANLGQPTAKRAKIVATPSPVPEVVVPPISHTDDDLAARGTATVLTLAENDGSDDDRLENDELAAQERAEQARKAKARRQLKVWEMDDTEEVVPQGPGITKEELFDAEPFEVADDVAPRKKSKSFKKRAKKEKKSASKPVDEPVEFKAPALSTVPDADDDLELVLSSARRHQLSRDEREARIAEHRVWDAADDVETRGAGIVFDDTATFLDHLRPDRADATPAITKRETEPERESVDSKPTDDPVADSSDPATAPSDPVADPLEPPKSFSSLASTLKYLQSTRAVDKPSAERLTHERAARDAEQQAVKLRLNVEIERRMLADELADDPEYRKMAADARETHFERLLARRIAARPELSAALATTTRAYNPEVDIAHYDSDGNRLSQKEAYKYQSHVFHGHKKR
ncbi:hypothetical protein DICA2_B09032 [Diutina catenulata]